jgi:hypothetical protein
MRAVMRPNMAPTAIPPQLTVKKASIANPYCPPGISGISQNVTIVLYRTIVTASVSMEIIILDVRFSKQELRRLLSLKFNAG